MNSSLKYLSALTIVTAGLLSAQQQQPPPPDGHGFGAGPPSQGMDHGPGMQDGPPPMQRNHGPMDRAMHVGPPGRWWSDPGVAQRLGLTADQQKSMDDLFQQSRLKLIDLSAALQKEEAIMEPLLAAERPEEPKILLQIDRIAQARAELEKANARMLLGLRRVLTQDQWKRLQAEAPRPPRPFGR